LELLERTRKLGRNSTFKNMVGGEKMEQDKNLIPRGYVWNIQWATRKNKKRRAREGMIMGIRKEVEEKEDRKAQKERD